VFRAHAAHFFKQFGLPRELRERHAARHRGGEFGAREVKVREPLGEIRQVLRALELALRFEDAGVAAIIYTDIGRDGMLSGLNIEQTLDLAFQLATPVIASGGVGGMADLRALREATHRGGPCVVEGVVIGRALYDGRLDLAEALALLAGG